MSLSNLCNVDLDDFEQKVIQVSDTTPVLVDFWADWCGPCIILAPILEKIAVEYNGSLQVAKLEVDKDENMKLAGQFQVRGFPTVILFEKGTEVERFSSAQSFSFIDQFIQAHSQLLT